MYASITIPTGVAEPNWVADDISTQVHQLLRNSNPLTSVNDHGGKFVVLVDLAVPVEEGFLRQLLDRAVKNAGHDSKAFEIGFP